MQTEKEIYQLLRILEPKDSNSKDNWHIKYSERLNDSIYIVDIMRNDHTPNANSGLCKILEFKGNKVFVYESSCKMTTPKELKSNSKSSPFFVPDSKYWKIMVRKNKINSNYYKLTVLKAEEYNDLKEDKEWK